MLSFTVETDKILLWYFNPLLPSVPFYTLRSKNLFRGHKKGIFGRNGEQVNQKINSEFPIWFPSKKSLAYYQNFRSDFNAVPQLKRLFFTKSFKKICLRWIKSVFYGVFKDLLANLPAVLIGIMHKETTRKP